MTRASVAWRAARTAPRSPRGLVEGLLAGGWLPNSGSALLITSAATRNLEKLGFCLEPDTVRPGPLSFAHSNVAAENWTFADDFRPTTPRRVRHSRSSRYQPLMSHRRGKHFFIERRKNCQHLFHLRDGR